MAAYVNISYVDNAITQERRIAVTGGSAGTDTVLDQFIAEETAIVMDAIGQQGRQAPTSLTELDALADTSPEKAIIKRCTLGLVVRRMQAMRKSIAWDPQLVTLIEAGAQIDQIRDGSVQLNALVVTPRDAAGGIDGTETDTTTNVNARPNVMKNLSRYY